MKTILLPHIDLLAYCLMTNHLHILFTPKEDLKKSSKAVSNLLNSYAKSFNKLYQRRGSLFLKHPKFVELPLDEDIKRTKNTSIAIRYIMVRRDIIIFLSGHRIMRLWLGNQSLLT